MMKYYKITLSLFLCFMLFSSFCGIASAEKPENEISFDIHFGYGSGCYYYGYVNPMKFVIVNNKEMNFHGNLTVSLVPNVYSKEIKTIDTEISVGEHSAKTIQKQLLGINPVEYVARLLDDAGNLIQEQRGFVDSKRKAALVGYISDNPSEFDWLLEASEQQYGEATVYVEKISADLFPQNAEQAAAFSLILVGNADFSASSKFSKSQKDLLFQYVSNGGTLILAGEEDTTSHLFNGSAMDISCNVSSSALGKGGLFFCPLAAFAHCESSSSMLGESFFQKLEEFGALNQSLGCCGETQDEYYWNDDFLAIPENSSDNNPQMVVLVLLLMVVVLVLGGLAVGKKRSRNWSTLGILVACGVFSALLISVDYYVERHTINWSSVEVCEIQDGEQSIKMRMVAQNAGEDTMVFRSGNPIVSVGDSVFALSHYRHHMMMDFFTFSPSYVVKYSYSDVEVISNHDRNGVVRMESFDTSQHYIPLVGRADWKPDGSFQLTVQNGNPFPLHDAVVFYLGNTIFVGDLETEKTVSSSAFFPCNRKFDFLLATEKCYLDSGYCIDEIVSLMMGEKANNHYIDNYYPSNEWFEVIGDSAKRNRARIMSAIARDVTDNGDEDALYIFGFDDTASCSWSVDGAKYGTHYHETLVYQEIPLKRSGE